MIGQQPHGLDGWFGYMGANSLAQDPQLPGILGSPAKVRQAVSRAAKAAETYRDDAAKRGDRVHNYCEQVALRALGRPHQMKETREALAANGEEAFAARFDEWWELFQVEPIAPEITVWNKTVGYAGTLDLVAKINGRTCLIDYKTKGTSRDGTVKPLDDKVVMQLVAGMKAEESLVDPVAGEWEAWKHGESPILLAVAVGETEVRPLRANPDVLKHHWWKFCALRRVWEMSADTSAAGSSPAPARAAGRPAEPGTADPERGCTLNWTGSQAAHREDRLHMAILNIRIIGDPVLRTVADPVTEFGPELAKLVADMTETMEDVEGAGLAAPQVGVSQRVFTYRIGGVEGHIINPVLENSEDFQPDQVEGCLSIPGLGFPVRRHRHTRVTGVDLHGNPVTVEGEGMLARCFQHETDHLDGILYTDRLEGEDRKAALRAIRNANYDAITEQTTSKRAKTVGSSFGAGSTFGTTQ